MINGSKIWTSGARIATHGLMLARTDGNVPKHRGLSMLIVPLGKHPVSRSSRSVQVNGEADFCQEFFDDVTVPADHLLGDENDGWAVAQRLLFHERNTTAGIGIGHGYMGHRSGRCGHRQDARRTTPATARCRGAPWRRPRSRRPTAHRPRLRRSLLAHGFTRTRIMAGQQAGELDGPWGSLLKLRVRGMGHAQRSHRVVAGDRGGERRDLGATTSPGGRSGVPEWIGGAGHLDRRRLQRDAAQHRERAPAGPPTRSRIPAASCPSREIQERRRQGRRAGEPTCVDEPVPVTAEHVSIEGSIRHRIDTCSGRNVRAATS